MIDLSENQLESLPKEIGDLENLEQFFGRHNKLKNLPYLEKCHKLKVIFKSIYHK
jgi:Leucine-rich repeat (LRR) protein